MKYSSQFTYLNGAEQLIEGRVAFDGATLTITEPSVIGTEPDATNELTLYFSSKEELATLVDMLCSMDKVMENDK